MGRIASRGVAKNDHDDNLGTIVSECRLRLWPCTPVVGTKCFWPGQEMEGEKNRKSVAGIVSDFQLELPGNFFEETFLIFRDQNRTSFLHCDTYASDPLWSMEGQQVGKWIEEIEGIERDQATSTWKYLALQLLIGRVEWVFQSDGGAEFTNTCFKAHLRTSGIHHQLSCPYTPAQNGRAERKHRHVTETGLTLLFHSHLSPRFWVDAFSTATYIINRLPTPLLGGKSPFELLYGHSPHYENFHPFGCRVYPCLRDYMPNKLSPRSIPCIFLGYSPSHKGFRCHLHQKCRAHTGCEVCQRQRVPEGSGNLIQHAWPACEKRDWNSKR
uniref:Integrase catalytic domain-containing protein n=1 Tax=Vitis vinifera TaxID=29760 RepID=A5B5G5_VITVI|nr:hypothetical protein VITISV_007535 [Vitis vinifera]